MSLGCSKWSQKTALLAFLDRSKTSDKKFTLLLRSGVFAKATVSIDAGVSRCEALVTGESAPLISGDLADESERVAFASRLSDARSLTTGEFRNFSMKKISALGISEDESLWEVTLNEEPTIGTLALESTGLFVEDSKTLCFRISGSREEALQEIDKVQDEILRTRVALSELLRAKIANSFRS